MVVVVVSTFDLQQEGPGLKSSVLRFCPCLYWFYPDTPASSLCQRHPVSVVGLIGDFKLPMSGYLSVLTLL